MIKKPMTTKEFFDKICEELKEQGKWPEILDYSLGVSEWDTIPLTTDEFELKNNLDYGGSEGIYLDLWLTVYDKEENHGRVKLGTFKTLNDGNEDMHIMAGLLADFILEEYRYVHEHRADFNWKGICIFPADENGKKKSWGRYCYSEDEIEEQKREFFKKYPVLVIENYETREEIVCKRELKLENTVEEEFER